MPRFIAVSCLAVCMLTLLALQGAIRSPRVVTHESLFPNHEVKPEGVQLQGRRRLGPPPPGHPRIVGDVRPDGGVSAESAEYPFAWEFIGPSVIDGEYWSGNSKASGRITSIAPHPTNPSICWISTDGGGVWKTSDDGASWKPLTDTLPTLRGGTLMLHPDNSDIVFWGTGDFRGSTTGAGLFRSVDGGETWSLFAGSSTTGTQIAGLSHSGGVPGVMHVAGSSGVRRSVDAGVSWTTKISGTVNCLWAGPGATKMYAGMRSDGVHRSTDSGATWTKCTSASFPTAGTFTVVTVGASRANPDTVFAAFVGSTSSTVTKLYRSTNGGVTWTRLTSADNFCSPQCWYDAYIAVDPTNASIVYLGGVDARYGVYGVAKSTDSGSTWSDIANAGGTQLHPDHHVMVFGPGSDNGTKIWEGNDGGVWTSTSGGASWSNRNSDLATALLYNVAVHPIIPERMLGGAQDNGTPERLGPVSSWVQLQTGDGGYSAFVPDYSGTRFTTYVYGRVSRWDSLGNDTQLTPSWTDPVAWIAPIALDPSNADRLYVGTNRLWVCTTARTSNPASESDRVSLWTALSATNTTASSSATINRFTVSESDPNTIYTGCSGGSVWVTRNRGATWTKRSVGLPTNGVCGISVSPHDPEEVWVAHYSTSGNRVHRSIDAGVTWTAMGGGLPAGVTPRALGIHFRRPGETRRTVLVGSGAGIYHSLDLGTTWTPNDTSVPNANIGDFHINRKDGLVTVATYGRGAWRAGLPRNCWSDIDFDDTVSSSDLGLLLLDYGECQDCISDLDSSGFTDGADLGEMLLEFGPCS
ncbi:MAG: hypothetical protein EXS04_06655 [Phycisphaerales bacterium]|nr:hypothetical protein [Phycisphaerales bacterium]